MKPLNTIFVLGIELDLMSVLLTEWQSKWENKNIYLIFYNFSPIVFEMAFL